MGTAAEIRAEIERVTSYYPTWTIGLTDNPARRRAEHGNPSVWFQWNADTQAIARSIEMYFLDRGMEGDVGGCGSADYVYIFI